MGETYDVFEDALEGVVTAANRIVGLHGTKSMRAIRTRMLAARHTGDGSQVAIWVLIGEVVRQRLRTERWHA